MSIMALASTLPFLCLGFLGWKLGIALWGLMRCLHSECWVHITSVIGGCYSLYLLQLWPSPLYWVSGTLLTLIMVLPFGTGSYPLAFFMAAPFSSLLVMWWPHILLIDLSELIRTSLASKISYFWVREAFGCNHGMVIIRKPDLDSWLYLLGWKWWGLCTCVTSIGTWLW